MTTFILQGGYTSTPTERNKIFYQEIVKRIPENGKVLFLYFAQDQNTWEELLENDREKFEKTGSRNLELKISNFPENGLIEQINNADCIYIRGGSNDSLREQLEKIDDLKKLIGGKVIVGSSAGANLLSTYFYTNDKERVERGLGVLPIKVFCHYNNTKKAKLRELENHGEKLPVYTIPEADFVIVEKE